MHLKPWTDNQLWRTSKGNQTSSQKSPQQQFWWSKSDAAPQHITKIDTVLPLESPTKNTSLQHLLQYIIMHGWHAVLQHQNCHMAGCYINPWDLCCTCFRTKRTCRIKISGGNKATDAMMLKNFHNDVEWRSKIVLVIFSGPLRWL